MSFSLANLYILPASSVCSAFNCVWEKNSKVLGLESCWTSGILLHEAGVWGSEALETHGPSTVNGKSLVADEAEERGLGTSTEATWTFCWAWENATSDCMALLKVSWCWTSWRTHLDRPAKKKTQHKQTASYHGELLPPSVLIRSSKASCTCDVLIGIILVTIIH